MSRSQLKPDCTSTGVLATVQMSRAMCAGAVSAIAASSVGQLLCAVHIALPFAGELAPGGATAGRFPPPRQMHFGRHSFYVYPLEDWRNGWGMCDIAFLPVTVFDIDSSCSFLLGPQRGFSLLLLHILSRYIFMKDQYGRQFRVPA